VPLTHLNDDAIVVDGDEVITIRLILSGHFHRSHAEDLRSSNASLGRSIIHVQAGTAISSRLRNQPNSYNLITIDDDRIIIEVREWHGTSFMKGETTEFRKKNGQWVRQP
jgi:3',5'-cyclic AMP phosphodiesterase CpdA